MLWRDEMISKDYKSLELSTQLIIKEALKRKIEVEVLDREDNFIRLKKGDKVEYIKQATRTSADTYIAPLIMENKEVTKIILKEYGLSVPESLTIRSVEDAMAAYPKFVTKDIVVKPKSTNFGKGITILKKLNSQKEFLDAVQYAFKEDKTLLIEDFIEGKEYRFLVIGDEVPAILHRVPANVKGDGVHSIRELVKIKNQDPLRGKNYVTPLEKINLGHVEEEFLKAQGKDFDYIPKENETVYLRKNSNISTGGDSIDYTDEISDAYKKIAIKAAQAVGAKICGADIIIKNLNEKPSKDNYSIIELNFNPALHIHDYPYIGKNREVEKKVLDLLKF